MKKILLIGIGLLASATIASAQIDVNQLKKLNTQVTDNISTDHVPLANGTNFPKWAKFDSLLTAKGVLTGASNYVSTSYSFAGDVTGTPTAMVVARLRGVNISSTAPTNGQVLKYNSTSTQWEAAADNNNIYTQGTGISISSNVITNTGDTNAADDITTSSTAGGDASGTFSALTVSKIRNIAVSSTAPTNGQVLKFNSTTSTIEWQADNDVPYTSGTGISISSNVITNTGDTNAADDITTSSTAGGDVTGTFSALTVTKIRGSSVAATTPTEGQVLKFLSGTWTPTTASKTYRFIKHQDVATAGTTVTITGITATADDDIIIYRNGVRQIGGTGRSWTRSGTTFTFTTPLVVGDVLTIDEAVSQ